MEIMEGHTWDTLSHQHRTYTGQQLCITTVDTATLLGGPACSESTYPMGISIEGKVFRCGVVPGDLDTASQSSNWPSPRRDSAFCTVDTPPVCDQLWKGPKKIAGKGIKATLFFFNGARPLLALLHLILPTIMDIPRNGVKWNSARNCQKLAIAWDCVCSNGHRRARDWRSDEPERASPAAPKGGTELCLRKMQITDLSKARVVESAKLKHLTPELRARQGLCWPAHADEQQHHGCDSPKKSRFWWPGYRETSMLPAAAYRPAAVRRKKNGIGKALAGLSRLIKQKNVEGGTEKAAED
ncbi:hypothetical protein C8J57DRAFT_1218745 [Mycena rebaudengoi]|nr:hypothetical protein C8J57DRAFT_1218745 [Mycena rebaudengoi]